MSTNHSYENQPLHSHGWDENEDQIRKRQRYNESNWGTPQGHYSQDDHPNPEGFTGEPGPNYALGRFSGAAEGFGLEADKYRGYYWNENTERSFGTRSQQGYGYSDYDRNDPERSYREAFVGNQESRYPHQQSSDHGSYGSNNQTDIYQGREHYNWPGGTSNRSSNMGSHEDEREGGLHRGKGPKNYRRSDNRIKEDVCDRLSDDPHIDASDIAIRVEDGNVVLSGYVENREARRRAVDVAESIKGVHNVESRLRIGKGLLETTSHAITAAIGDVTLGPETSTVEEPKKGKRKKYK